MPNWVDNSLRISGEPEALNKFMEKASQPYSVGDSNKESEGLLFWNFVKPSQEVDYENNWYDWNVENWGTKWEACYVSLDMDLPDSGEIGYFFQTAWAIPEPVYEAMVAQHPELNFYVYCKEEQGWGREYEGKNGVLTILDDWDIPDSHAECVKRDSTCACEWAEEPSDFYPDCPDYKPKEKTPEEKLREKIIEASGVSKEWADQHLIVIGASK